MASTPVAVTSRIYDKAGPGAERNAAASGARPPTRDAASLLSLGDADLVGRAVGARDVAPDPEAFGELYRRHRHAVFAFALRKVHNRAQAEDLTSQTFLQALRALPRYEQRGVPLQHWLFRITANLIGGLHRTSTAVGARIGKGAEYERGVQGGVPILALPDPYAEAAMVAWEEAEAFRRLVDDLRPEQRTVIRLRVVEGLAIAAQTGRSEGAVKALQCRGLRRLRSRWGQGDPQGGQAGTQAPRGHSSARSTPANTRERRAMLRDRVTERGDGQRRESVLVDGILHNGVDGLAVRRAHMRALTMARQAAERRSMRAAGRDGSARLVAARERAAELRAELARIDAEHRTWLHEQGEDAAARRTRRRRAPGAAPAS